MLKRVAKNLSLSVKPRGFQWVNLSKHFAQAIPVNKYAIVSRKKGTILTVTPKSYCMEYF